MVLNNISNVVHNNDFRTKLSIDSERDCFPHQRYYNKDANMYFDKNRVVASTERSITYIDNNDRMSIRSDDGKYGGTRNEIVRRVNDEKAARNNSNGKYHY